MEVKKRIEAYPKARVSDTTDTFHGQTVADPYRWLEQEGPEREEWIEAERQLYETYAPSADVSRAFRERLNSYVPDVSDGVPYRHGGRSFFSRFYKGQNYQQVVELRSDGSESVVLDPNSWSEKDAASPAGYALSPKGNFIASGRSLKGNDLKEWHIINTTTGAEVSEQYIETFQGSVTWLRDESGFFYTKTFEDQRRAIYFHKLEDDPARDEAFFVPEQGDITWYGHTLSDNDEMLYVHASPANGEHSISKIDLTKKDHTPQLLAAFTDDREADVAWYENGKHILVVNQDTPHGRIVTIDWDGAWTDLIAETEDALLGVEMVANRILIQYYSGTSSYLKVFERDGTLAATVLPDDEVGMISFSSQDSDNPVVYLYVESPVHAPVTYSYNVSTGEKKLVKESDYLYDREAFDVSLDYAESPDGTSVPMFICRAKDTPLDANAPTIMYGYGGFQVSLTPDFNKNILPWLEAGGIYITACIRGGGEFGAQWRKAGAKLNKQKAFNDFIACAEKLCDLGVTSPDKLAIKGESNGGLLVGAVMTQRPDLVRAVLPGAGLFDMLRYDKGNQALAGRNWRTDYGSTDNPQEFEALLAYSPVHNVKPVRYPAVLASVGEDDDRVRPWNTYKFIAALQASQQGEEPILMNVESAAGHNLPGHERIIARYAMQYAFLSSELGLNLENCNIKSR